MIWEAVENAESSGTPKLRHLGIGRDLAAQTASSPHGPWLWRTVRPLLSAISIAYFDSLGLLGC